MVHGKECVKLTGSVDGCWSKAGPQHNAQSGCGAYRHQKDTGGSGKIMSIMIRVTACRMCAWHLKKNPEATDEELEAYAKTHECAKNYNGSASSMEAHCIVAHLEYLYTKGIVMDFLVMDDDSTTAANLRKGSKDLKIPEWLALEVYQFLADPNHRQKAIKDGFYKHFDKATGARIGALCRYLR